MFLLGGYLAIERLPWLHRHAIATTAIDRAIGFSPRWVYVYASYYLFPLLAALIEKREDLVRYFFGFILICVLSFICFVIWPIELPRPEGAAPFLYNAITMVDRPTNCLPSLHLALSTFTVGALLSSLGKKLPLICAIGLLLWVVAIAYATMATKQHYFVDVVTGVALGWVVQGFFWRGSKHPA